MDPFVQLQTLPLICFYAISKSAADYCNSVRSCRNVYWFSGASCCSQVGRGSGLRRKMPGVCCSVTNLCKHLTSKPFRRTVWAATARLWWPLTTLIKTLSLASDNYHNKHRSLGEILHHFLPCPTRLYSYCNYYHVFFYFSALMAASHESWLPYQLFLVFRWRSRSGDVWHKSLCKWQFVSSCVLRNTCMRLSFPNARITECNYTLLLCLEISSV